MQQTDAELVEAACQGDVVSFGRLYERHYRLAVGIAYSRLSDRHLAEDAAQEAFAVVCRTLATLKDGRRFPQWLGTICRRVATRLARSRPRHEPLPEDNALEGVPTTAALRNQIHEALERLDATSREIILLHYFSGQSYEEISRALGLSAQSIHGRLQRARRKLAQELDPDSSEGTQT